MAGISTASVLAAVLIGFSKAGIKGITAISVTLLALAYGAKASTGIILPLLIAGDIAAVAYYSKKCNWQLLFKLLPYLTIGVIIGAFIGDELPEELFKKCMAVIIIVSVILMVWHERSTIQLHKGSTGLGMTLGLLAGITTMIGNLAGAFSNLFFLSMRLTKETFIGTAAWLFFIINLFKLPFHIYMWETIDLSSLYIGLRLLPFVGLGFIGGLKLLNFFTDNSYRYFIIMMTLIGAVVMLIS